MSYNFFEIQANNYNNIFCSPVFKKPEAASLTKNIG